MLSWFDELMRFFYTLAEPMQAPVLLHPQQRSQRRRCPLRRR